MYDCTLYTVINNSNRCDKTTEQKQDNLFAYRKYINKSFFKKNEILRKNNLMFVE